MFKGSCHSASAYFLLDSILITSQCMSEDAAPPFAALIFSYKISNKTQDSYG